MGCFFFSSSKKQKRLTQQTNTKDKITRQNKFEGKASNIQTIKANYTQPQIVGLRKKFVDDLPNDFFSSSKKQKRLTQQTNAKDKMTIRNKFGDKTFNIQTNKANYTQPQIVGLRKKFAYDLTNEDAKILSKTGFQTGQPLLSIAECKKEMVKQFQKLKKQYHYSFNFKESSVPMKKGKTMTRTIYLKFTCKKCNKQWTTIAGTFQIKFVYQPATYRSPFELMYFITIFGSDCGNCKSLAIPFVYKTQMEAMKIYFSVILTNILDQKPVPQKPNKYYIRQNHWHKSEWCQACKLGKCTTQNRLDKNSLQ